MNPRGSFQLLAVLVCTAAGCDGGDLEVTAEADGDVASPASPVEITVTATNVGDERVSWGRGSSSCQLSLVVRVGGSQQTAVEERVCTSDLAEWSLDPGESRTEVLPWGGLALIGGEAVLLSPGVYAVRGAAGMAAFSRAGEIMVMGDIEGGRSP